MKKLVGKKMWIALLIVAALIGSAAAVSALEKNHPKEAETSTARPGSSALYNEVYHALYGRGRWLCDLMTLSGKVEDVDGSSAEKIIEQAKSCGIVDMAEEELSEPLDRRFVAQTTVRALGYKKRSVGYLADVAAIDCDMATMAYYGYFLPDISSMLYPDREISADDYNALISELIRYGKLKGKTILSFGDSIMYGNGNDGEGISDMIAEKYGMTAFDYSVPGAAIGDRPGRGHIRDQLSVAVKDQVKPDIILLNGGTNDMNNVEFGAMTDGFDMAKTEEKSFTGGLEKTYWSLEQSWKGVPIVYVRVHNMDLGPDENERKYGERALEVAEKWGALSVDLYNGTDMNTENPETCIRYTSLNDNSTYLSDSIHPTALGYAKFYLPKVSQAVEDQLQSEEKA